MLIKNGRVIDPASNFDGICDLVIEDGKIKEMAADIDESGHEEVFDASNLVVAPGFVDVHVHFRDPGFTYKEDLLSGSKSAVAGGFTSVVCMANTKPIIDNQEALADVLNRAKECPLHIYQAAAISKDFKGEELCDMAALLKAGAVGFTDDGLPLKDEAFVLSAMKLAKELDTVLSFHEEDPAYIGKAGVNEGKISAQMGIKGADRMAENVMVERDIHLAAQTGAKISIQHISSKEAVDLVRIGKKMGVNVVAEATPHHFSLNEEAVLKYGTLAKMNPPLREESDRLAIIEGLKDNTIEIIATDHAPHAYDEKNRPFTEAPSGIIGLETSLSLGIMNLVDPAHLTLMELIAKMSTNPAKLYQLNAGEIKVGAAADLVLFDPEASYSVEKFVSKSNNSPFVNELLKGKVIMTLVDGKIVYRY